MTKRQNILNLIMWSVAKEGKVGREAIRAYVEQWPRLVSEKAFREAAQRGYEIFKKTNCPPPT